MYDRYPLCVTLILLYSFPIRLYMHLVGRLCNVITHHFIGGSSRVHAVPLPAASISNTVISLVTLFTSGVCHVFCLRRTTYLSCNYPVACYAVVRFFQTPCEMLLWNFVFLWPVPQSVSDCVSGWTFEDCWQRQYKVTWCLYCRFLCPA